MEIKTEVLLAPYTTFHIGGPAAFFCEATNAIELQEAITIRYEHDLPLLILGGGSNILVADRGFAGMAIQLRNTGIEMLHDNPESVILRIASGEIWDDVVSYAVDNNWWGIENLSHIPGRMGGFAVQNVGAYGQEASDVVVSVELLDTETGVIKTLANEQCNFSYRQSIFNGAEKGRYVILHTSIRLSKIPAPVLSYGDLKKYFSDQKINTPSIQQIRTAIITIRNTKFPFPDKPERGNAGSFFRGPIIDEAQQQQLFAKVEESFGEQALVKLKSMKDRLIVPQGMKTPTGFLIELCNLKGWRVGGAEVNPDQAAIVLNATGTATAQDVMELFKHVRLTVFQKTGLELHIEPELIGFSAQELAAAYAIMV